MPRRGSVGKAGLSGPRDTGAHHEAGHMGLRVPQEPLKTCTWEQGSVGSCVPAPGRGQCLLTE